MRAFSGFLAFLFAVVLLSASGFIAIAITTGQSVRFWEESESPPMPTTSDVPTEPTTNNTVEINFVFCTEPEDGLELTATTCSPVPIRDDSKVFIQLANGEPITIDGFETVKTGFKITIDAGDTVMAISIENQFFPPITFGGSTLKLEQVSETRTVYLPI
jgi:hypothetical protein